MAHVAGNLLLRRHLLAGAGQTAKDGFEGGALAHVRGRSEIRQQEEASRPGLDARVHIHLPRPGAQ